MSVTVSNVRHIRCEWPKSGHNFSSAPLEAAIACGGGDQFDNRGIAAQRLAS